MEETVFFNFNGIIVSNSRFIVRSQTYTMQSVTSVKPGVIKPSRAVALAFILTGMLLLIAELAALELLDLLDHQGVLLVAGVVAILIGLIAWYLGKPRYSVILHTSAGEHHALVSDNKQDIEHVLQALNQAIVSRG
jgi:predicted membrane channel-forming protein YqfA (hemolysin III family)